MSNTVGDNDKSDESNMSVAEVSVACLCSICPEHPVFSGEEELMEHYRQLHGNNQTNIENTAACKGKRKQ